MGVAAILNLLFLIFGWRGRDRWLLFAREISAPIFFKMPLLSRGGIEFCGNFERSGGGSED